MSFISESIILNIMVTIRFFVAFLLIGSSSVYILNPAILLEFLNDIADKSLLTGGVFSLIRANDLLVAIFQLCIISVELYLGWSLLIGFLIRLSGIIGIFFFGTISLIQIRPENFFPIIMPLSLFTLCMLLVQFNSNRLVLAKNIIPESLRRLQSK